MKKRKPTKVVFELDVVESQTIESLAEQQRKFLAANRPPPVDAEMLEQFQLEDIEWALELKAKRERPKEFNERYRELTKKRQEERLTEAEHEALIRLTDEAELKQAERLQALVELARLRNMSLQEVMDALGIKPPAVE
jgi:hypothetical protein